MSFSTEQVVSERLMVPGGAISAIRQVQCPRLSPDLLRFAAFISTTAIHVAAEFRFTQAKAARVLAKVSAFLRLSPPGENLVSVLIVFTGDITTLHPRRHTEIFRQLRGWATDIMTTWVRFLAWPRDHIVTTNDVDLQLRVSSTAPELDVSILDAAKSAQWWHAYVALNFYLLEVVFHWVEPADKSEEDDDEVELLIIQASRMDTEGELLGIVLRVGEVHDGHLDSITDELLVFLAQLMDNLPLEILSRCGERPGRATLARTLVPHLLWSTCTKLDGDICYYPSEGVYLAIDVVDLSFWDSRIRRVNVGETSEKAGEEEEEDEAAKEEIQKDDHLQYIEREEMLEEEESEAGSDDPDYHELEDAESEEASSRWEESEEGEGGLGELSGPAELSREENEAVAQRKRAEAEGRRPIEESKGSPPQLLQGDPTLSREPPQEEIERNGGATAEGSGSRCCRRSESLAQSSPRPSLPLRRDAGAPAVLVTSSPFTSS
ncbi:hypothetical protein CBR_g49683 [Chara braunii]|uniref:Uncharacterized protein n=1 Tax=Chara braunii TaxID=69332 RepID=A0A388M5H4_CHABU|nr:hypothetical protein CBR_g49683 [Chara braunii]|eukprot:GBG89834.1 hypothetical protein CBR_g49683 [Chara braunii]